MTTPGPDKIIICPVCGALCKYRTINSGNTCGAVTWTDGRMIAPMLPLPPAIMMCRTCDGVFWLKDTSTVGEIEPFEQSADHPDWNRAPFIRDPSDVELLTAIDQGLARTPAEERGARVFAWWKSNDHAREQQETTAAPESAERQKNLESLVSVLSEKAESDRLMKAEVLRQLGRFDEARDILGTVSSEECAPAVKRLSDLCDARDRVVRPLFPSETDEFDDLD